MVGPGPSRSRLGAPRDLAALPAGDPGNLLPDGSGRVCRGDGALGSEGFFARLDADGNLVGPVSPGESDPFVRVEAAGSSATSATTSATPSPRTSPRRSPPCAAPVAGARVRLRVRPVSGSATDGPDPLSDGPSGPTMAE